MVSTHMYTWPIILLALPSLFISVSRSHECSSALGMESRHIKDAQITASSQWGRNHAAIQGRLNFKAGGGKQGGWSARWNNGNQWIQVALGSYTKLTSIATQGRNAYSQWVTAYKLQYSEDGVNFYYYKVPGQSSPKVFKGNKDRDSIVYHKISPPIQARYIRLRPTAWYGHISLRMELYGCLECSTPLGLESRRIKNAQVTASSQWDGNHAAIQGRLNFKAGGGKQGGWSARQNNKNQWIQVALGSYTKLTSIATQGRNAQSQWVTAYKLQYSEDGVNFYYYKVPGQSSPKVFKGNKDRDSIVYHHLNPPIKARYIKLRPTAWYGHISLRMELYGCTVECSTPLGLESRRIKNAQVTASSQWDGNHAAIQGRLNFKAGGGKQGGWSARQNNKNQWIQVALGSYTKLTSIATQGRNAQSQWVTAYKLQYSEDGVNFYYYKVPGQSSPKVFKGNKDRDSIVYHHLNPPIEARYIKLRPTAWYGHISLRMELYGCSVAPGVNVLCGDKTMTIVIPKTLLRGLDLKNIRLLDTKCKGKEGRTHLSVTTSLTGCKTARRYTPTAIIYSNILKIPVAAKSAVTRVRDIKVQFSCYYSAHGIVSSLGWTPIKTTFELREKAKGNLTLSLRMFHNKAFVNSYTKVDFPVAVELHRRLYFEVSVATDDKKLSVRADRCYATPTRDQKNSLKYEFIKKGCPSDATVKYHSSPSSRAQRFSVEAFKFIAAHPFVFVHCQVNVCNATNPGSKCSMKCPSSGRGKRELSDNVTYDVYSLVQGPLHLTHEKRKENRGRILDKTGSSPHIPEALSADNHHK
ncbi:uncharacterized protein [Pocillopora verrucosa]|uniref:uncharacterized protein isoform X1 n=2 Tax=Pocillopora verrucosa TaxID=203993 RepID=UPI00334004B2